MKLPYMQFYPTDYLVDTAVLSLAAQGAWMRILCALHASDTRGSKSWRLEAWARYIGVTPDVTRELIAEIGEAGVGNVEERDGNVTLTNRRMLTESITKEQTRLRVQRHRLKTRRTQEETSGNGDCNAAGNADVADKKSETRNQKPEEETTSPSSPSSPAAPNEDTGGVGVTSDSLPLVGEPVQPLRNPPVLFAEVVELYNRLCPSMPRAELTEPRKKAIRARWSERLQAKTGEPPLVWFERLFQTAQASDFLAGRVPSNGSAWRCNFDWLIGPKNAPKVIEGNYDNNRNGGTRQPDRGLRGAF